MAKSRSLHETSFIEGLYIRTRQVLGEERGAVPDASRRYGIASSTIRQYYTRKTPPSIYFIWRMSQVDGISLRWLITGFGPREADPEADAAAAVITSLPPIQRDLMLTIIGGVRDTGKG